MIAFALLACFEPPPAAPPSHDAYIWQRVWTDDVRDAVVAGQGLFDAYRVQAIAIGPTDPGPLDVDLTILANRTVVPVARVEVGAGTAWGDLGRTLAELVRRWRAAGIQVSSVEIDHDCPTSSLSEYADNLLRVQEALPDDVELWHTALPTWNEAPRALARLRRAAHGSIVQVHAVDPPGQALFDAERAQARIRRYAQIARAPFRVALPAYGAQVGGQELFVPPADAAGLLAALDRDPPRGWVGVAWFRLPIRGDQRTWPLATLAAVIRGEAPTAAWWVDLQGGGDAPYDVTISNRGGAPGLLPPIELKGACTVADGLRGLRAVPRADGFGLEPTVPVVVQPEQTLAIGWARCSAAPAVEIP